MYEDRHQDKYRYLTSRTPRHKNRGEGGTREQKQPSKAVELTVASDNPCSVWTQQNSPRTPPDPAKIKLLWAGFLQGVGGLDLEQSQ